LEYHHIIINYYNVQVKQVLILTLVGDD